MLSCHYMLYASSSLPWYLACLSLTIRLLSISMPFTSSTFSPSLPPLHPLLFHTLYLLSFSMPSYSSPSLYPIFPLLFHALYLSLSYPDVNRSADCDVFMHKNVSFGIMCVDPVRSLGKYMSADFTIKLDTNFMT